MFPIRTIEIEKNWDEPDYRIYRDMSVLTSDPESSILLPENPLISELNRWARNVTYLQVGFATSGGGASAFRTIAILETMAHKGLWVDVFAGLSGGAVIGAFLAADEANGLDRVVNKAKKSGPILPSTMISTKPIEHLVNEELGFKRVGQTSLRFGAATAELCNDGDKPARQIIREGTLGQAVRASGALPILFAPCSVDGRRFTDGMAATIVPTDVAIEHGADIVLSVNCIPGPDRTNPYDESLLGRLAYLTPIGRAIDSWTWISFLVQNASKAYAHGADVFFEFLPDKISSMEPVKWWQADKIRDAAWNEQARIIDAVEDLRDVWIKKHKAITGQDYTNFPP
ncbi:MAG: patatin-like phospholipase family protein [Gammaproteobacteria bacterium]